MGRQLTWWSSWGSSKAKGFGMRNLLARKPIYKFRHSFSDTNVNTNAWVELLSSLTKAASAAEIFNSSGAILKLALAAAGQEADNEMDYYVLPTGSPILLPLEFDNGVRLAARAVDVNATTGSLVINFFS